MKNILLRFFVFLIPVSLVVSCNNREIPPEVYEPGNGPYLSKVADDLYFVEDFNNGGNICFLVAKAGVLVVDAGNYPGPVRKVVEIIGKVSDKPITKLVYTHVHGDHVGGAAGYPEDIEIIAHENLNANLEKFVTPGVDEFKKDLEAFGEDSLKSRYGERYYDLAERDIRPATETFSEKKVIDMGNYTVELSYPGTCHTTDNILVLFNEQKVLHTGDLVFNHRHPYISSAYEADPWNWAETVMEWSKRDLVRIIPGHGEIGGTEILKAQADYLNTLIEAAGNYKESQLEINEIAEEIHNEYFADFSYGAYFAGGIKLILDKLAD